LSDADGVATAYKASSVKQQNWRKSGLGTVFADKAGKFKETSMRTNLLTAAAAIALASITAAAPASATVYPVATTGVFTASPAASDGSFTGAFRLSGIGSGTFSDSFTFTLPTNGIGSGSVTTSASMFASSTDLDFTSVTINGVTAPISFNDSQRLGENAVASSIPIVANVLNTLTVNYISRGNGSYGGQLTFTPMTAAVPETATWLMMLAGFGMIGAGVRYRRRATTVAFA
jgi:hypothetical protein